jgi:tRNA (guanine37-N1)-methyltransferase
MRLREILEKRFPEHEIENVKGSFDIIGDVAILEIPEELAHRELDVVDALREIHPNIETVYKKESEREGVYRLRDLKLIYGDETETEHREHGFKIRLDVRKVYFSPREGTERQRIAKQVKAKETVMVMFAGAGPYALAIAKRQPRVKKVYAVEMNPDAYKYMVENIRINKLGHKVVPILGDVDSACMEYFGKCDRVVMPLPKGAYEYLKLAAKCLKKGGGFIHYYFWSSEDGIEEIKEIVEVDMTAVKRKIKSTKVQKVSEYKPKIIKFCIDIKAE